MASLYKRARSPFWWIQFKDGAGRITRRSTKQKWAIPAETKKAELERARREVSELDRARGDSAQKWEAWVPAFLKLHCDKLTFKSYELHWRTIRIFLRSREIIYPTQLTYRHCVDFVAWRIAGDKPAGVKPVVHNTALVALKVLRLVMKQAVRRGFCASNPAAAMGIRMEKCKVKPEITEQHLRVIHDSLAGEPAWMLTAFTISLYTGCRIAETRIRMDCVDLERRKIHFADPKGGKPFTVPMRAELVPLFTRLAESGAEWTYDPQPMPSLVWCKFFKRISLSQYSFHCLRVTFISRGARAGVDERAMRRLVNHASETIHAVYQRFTTDDLRAPLDAIPLPSLERTRDCPEAT